MHHVDIRIESEIFKRNRERAQENARKLLNAGVRAVELLGAIGSGKTALIEYLIPILTKKGMRVGAIAGDVTGDDDYQRLRARGIPVYNANTGRECHLDATLVASALTQLPLSEIDILFIENVGNLICPTDFILGAEMRIVIVSTTEGDDVVNKHPLIFKVSEIAVINKIDLAESVGADLTRMERDIHKYNPGMPVFLTNLKTGAGIQNLITAILGDTINNHEPNR